MFTHVLLITFIICCLWFSVCLYCIDIVLVIVNVIVIVIVIGVRVVVYCFDGCCLFACLQCNK